MYVRMSILKFDCNMSIHVKITKFKILNWGECVFEGTKLKKANYFSYEKY